MQITDLVITVGRGDNLIRLCAMRWCASAHRWCSAASTARSFLKRQLLGLLGILKVLTPDWEIKGVRDSNQFKRFHVCPFRGSCGEVALRRSAPPTHQTAQRGPAFAPLNGSRASTGSLGECLRLGQPTDTIGWRQGWLVRDYQNSQCGMPTSIMWDSGCWWLRKNLPLQSKDVMFCFQKLYW